MKTFIRLAKKRPETSVSGLETSAALPNSGFAFLDNSQGASAAVSELSTTLGDALDLIDLDGNVEEKVRKLFHDLDHEASKYSNSSIDVESAVPWACASSTATLISSAWKCALGVYTPEETLPNTKTHRFQQIYKVAASAKGVVKAMTCTVAQPIDTTAGPPVLIIAIRGSASKIDHVVNANTRSDYMSRDQSITGHAGFVHSAEAVVSEVESQILAHKAQMRPSRDCPCHVVLTGHSAGGAVASLLYLLLSSRDDSDMRLSCIIFGAPPCVSSTVNLSAVKSGLWDPPVCLNIINEFDFVSRADPPYLLCVINLLRSMYGLPSLEPSSDNDTKAPTTSSDTDSVSILNEDDDAIWPTPPGLYRHVGELVVLATRLDEAANAVRMHALNISPTQLSQLLFCRLSVHRRACYDERISLLASQSSVSEQR